MKLTLCWFLATASLLAIPAVDAQLQDNTNEIRDKMAWMENEIKKTMASGCSIQTQSLTTYIQTIWWPHIQYLASRKLPQEQQDVLAEYNRLLYMLGQRNCQLPNETLYQGQCYPIGVSGYPCPKYQQLYNRPDNTGYCYCQRNAGKGGLIYIGGQCYKQNEQGPCKKGQWLTVKGQTPRCEKVPRGCPADGQHVYWSCNDGDTRCQIRRTLSNNQKKCSRIGSRQPSCGAGAKLFRSGMKFYCGSPKMVDWNEPSVTMILPPADTCQQSQQSQQVQLVEEEINIPEFNQLQPIEETAPVNNNNKKRPCPANYYRDAVDGRCKRLF